MPLSVFLRAHDDLTESAKSRPQTKDEDGLEASSRTADFMSDRFAVGKLPAMYAVDRAMHLEPDVHRAPKLAGPPQRRPAPARGAGSSRSCWSRGGGR